MPHPTPGNRGRSRQRVPRIGSKAAARIISQCERLLGSSSVFVENLGQVGFARFMAPLNEQILNSRYSRTRGESRPGPVRSLTCLLGFEGFPLKPLPCRKSCRSRILSCPAFSSS
jgi:hypothetical protein